MKKIEIDKLIKLTPDQLRPASQVLVRAFDEDPLMQHFFPDPIKKKEKLTLFMEFMISYCLKFGVVYVTSSNLEGVILLLDSKAAKMSIVNSILNGGMIFAMRMGWQLIFRMLSEWDDVFLVHEQSAPPDYGYIFLLGVDPKFQGQGYSSLLMRPILAWMKDNNLPCCLDAYKENNVLIYKHFGFEVAQDHQIPNSNVHDWFMIYQ